jgi:hypothetical protein
VVGGEWREERINGEDRVAEMQMVEVEVLVGDGREHGWDGMGWDGMEWNDRVRERESGEMVTRW